ncbi:hypothetical protein [Micromonospora sp. NPDC051141]|uniref:hypothetical protein n=1 Tax=Micromonospora sp. NPDC051141 TaxID=3364284 RepID=UPI00378ABB50
MDALAWQEVIGAIGLFALVITVLALVIREVAKTLRAKAAIARDNDYRELAKRSTAAEEAVEVKLTGIDTRMEGLEKRLAAIEHILKDVE